MDIAATEAPFYGTYRLVVQDHRQCQEYELCNRITYILTIEIAAKNRKRSRRQYRLRVEDPVDHEVIDTTAGGARTLRLFDPVPLPEIQWAEVIPFSNPSAKSA